MTTPGPGGPQSPEQDPAQSGQPQNWGQQPPAGQPAAGQPFPGQQPPAGQPFGEQPPAGQQPWGAAQQPTPGQQPWGAAQQPSGAQAFGQPQQPAKPKRKVLSIIGGLVAAVVVFGVLSTFLGGDPEVGECVKAEGFNDISTVDCDSDEATLKIIGVGDEMTGDEFDATPGEELCADFPEATDVLWYGSTDDGDGTVYCATGV